MVLFKRLSKKEETNPNLFLGNYNLNGIPFHHYADPKDINLNKGNVIRDINRVIILKPITREKIVEVMVEEIEEKIVYVPQVQVVDKYVEVVKPIIKYKIKEVKRPVTVEKIKKVAKIVEEEKILEVPEIKYIEKFVEVPKVVKREKIIEIPLPIVRERRIPVLNVSKKERFQELDSIEFKALNPSESLFGGSSIDMESSIHSSPIQYYSNEKYEDNQENDSKYGVEHKKEPLDHNEQVSSKVSEGEEIAQYTDVTEKSENENTEKPTSEEVSLMDIYTEFKERESEHNSSKLRYFDSKLANYNSSEGERQMLEELSEISSNTNTKNYTQEEYEENKIEIVYGLNVEYPNIHNLSITKGTSDYSQDRRDESGSEKLRETSKREAHETYEDQVRKGRFESKVLLSPELEEKISKKLIQNVSTQVIPKSIKIVDRKRRLKMDNK